MVKRFYPDKRALKSLLTFKNYDKDTQNVLADSFYDHVQFLQVTKDDNQTKISVCQQTVKKYTGGQAFIATTSRGCICYYKDNNKMYTQSPAEVIVFLQCNPYIVKALGLDAFIPISEEECRKNHLEVGLRADPDQLSYRPSVEILVLRHKLVLKAIIKGLCTNFDDATRRYTKAVYGMNISYKVYSEMSKLTASTSLMDLLKTTTNLQNLYRFITQRYSSMSSDDVNILKDLIAMSLTLRRKINYQWSNRRFLEEHDNLSFEILRLKAQSTKLREVEYKVEPPEIEGIQFFTNNKALLLESNLMKHCIGTSDVYINKLVSFKSLLISYNRRGLRATADIRLNYKRKNNELSMSVSQFQARGSDEITNEHRKDLNEVLLEIARSPFSKYLVEEIVKTPEVIADTIFNLPEQVVVVEAEILDW